MIGIDFLQGSTRNAYMSSSAHLETLTTSDWFFFELRPRALLSASLNWERITQSSVCLRFRLSFLSDCTTHKACGSGAVSTSKPGVGALGSGQTAGETVVRTVLSPKGRAAHATESTGKIPTRSVQQASSVSTPSCSPDVLLNSSTSLSLPMSGAATPTLHSRFADLRDEMKRRRCNGGLQGTLPGAVSYHLIAQIPMVRFFLVA